MCTVLAATTTNIAFGVYNRCPNCNTLLTNEQPSVAAGLPHSALEYQPRIQGPNCKCLLEDHKLADPFTRKLFLTISMIIILNVMTTLAFGSTPIADIMLAIMVATLLIAMPLCAFRWCYLKLAQGKASAGYRMVQTDTSAKAPEKN